MAISCEVALDRLLEADPAELAGRGETELTAHVRECPRCQAVAARLQEGQEELGRALSELRPRAGVEEALILARARRRRMLKWRKAWRWAAPVAGAAVLAGVFLLRSPDTGRMPGEIVPLPVKRIEPLVDAPLAQNVMVFEREDRSVRVIWFY